ELLCCPIQASSGRTLLDLFEPYFGMLSEGPIIENAKIVRSARFLGPAIIFVLTVLVSHPVIAVPLFAEKNVRGNC
ncbi:MAG: hypothetical protein ACREO5_09475, partial [Candidatus Binatia bacterium]